MPKKNGKANGQSVQDNGTITMALTPRQEAFARAYAAHNSATQAAKDAGYSAVSAANTGSRLMKNAQVRALIEETREQLGTNVSLDEKGIINQLTIEALRTGKGGTHAGRIKALELLARMKGMLVERVEQETTHVFAVSDEPELDTEEWITQYAQ